MDKEYLTDADKLDYQKLYSEMAEITGFLHKQLREELYNDITTQYAEYKGDKDSVQPSRFVHTGTQIAEDKNVELSEQDVVDRVNELTRRNFKLVTDDYSPFDAEDMEYIAEIKIRNKHYPEVLIEFDKFDSNTEYAFNNNVESLYIVATNEDIYIFNLSKLALQRFRFKWDWKVLPKNTDFGGSEQKISKFVGFIPIEKASVHYKNQS
tara:strand:+ start:844 stop:1470 length:627 start_codon:yes stop_codon:yes gene_type:complete